MCHPAEVNTQKPKKQPYGYIEAPHGMAAYVMHAKQNERHTLQCRGLLA